ncbi:PE family protein, partial [Mycobacterium sp. THU-M104]|uniref:PE family protein n=1 Tax=Mycobacterium sp. THU-M104 TaxID=3410515 RepID=UPI003B9AF08B
MSCLVVAPEMLAAASGDMANIGSMISGANAAAAAPTAGLLAAGADEVSALVASAFAEFGRQYQVLRAQAALFHEQFVQLVNAGAQSYTAAEAAGVAPLQTVGRDVLAAVNAPTEMMVGRPLIG